MKTKVILIWTILIFIFSWASLLYGQDSVRANIKIKTLTLKGGSGEQEVTLPLRDSLNYISFEIKAVITDGELTVELFDPAGVKYGNFSLAGSSKSSAKQEFVRGKTYNAEASGSLVRYVKSPQKGMWKAKVITKNAAGVIEFNLTREVTILKLN